jgi:hypothetical protein
MAMAQRRWGRARKLVHILAALGALARCLSPSSSEAGEPPRVVMVTAGDLPPTGERVRAELAAMGFAVVLDEDGSREPTRDALVEAARDRAALAAVALTFSDEGVELWVVERAKQETRLRSFVPAEHTGADPTLALRASELLRATLLAVAAEHDTAAVPAPAQQQPAPELPAQPAKAPLPSVAAVVVPSQVPADSDRTVTLRLGSGLVLSAGGPGAFPALDLAAKLWLTRRLGVELVALLPLAQMSEQGSEGASSTRVGTLSLSLAASLPLGESDWVWDIGAGVAAVALETKGSPASPAYTREHDVAAAVAPLVRSGLSYSLTRSVRAALAASLGLSFPRFLILYADRTAATWGRPFASGELALELDVP